MSKPRKVTLRTVTAAYRERVPFDANGTLTGDVFERGSCHILTGRLDSGERAKFLADVDDIVYVVRSYATPIMWETAQGDTYEVTQRFSVTTSKHQGRLY